MLMLTVQDRLDITELIGRLCQALDFSHPEDFVEGLHPGGGVSGDLLDCHRAIIQIPPPGP